MNIDSRRRKIDHGQSLFPLRISYLPTSKLVTVSHLPLSRAMPFVDIENIFFFGHHPLELFYVSFFCYSLWPPTRKFSLLSSPFDTITYTTVLLRLTGWRLVFGTLIHRIFQALVYQDCTELITISNDLLSAGATVCNCLFTTTVCSISL